MPQRASDHATVAFEQAERRLFAACGVQVASRRVRLADPPVAVRVLEAGDGPPLVLVHGSGMSASTWAPLMPYLGTRRLIAFDLPGFGLSDAFDYSGRPAASARGCPAHLAAGRARPRAGADRRHLAGRDVGALPGRRRAGSHCRLAAHDVSLVIVRLSRPLRSRWPRPPPGEGHFELAAWRAHVETSPSRRGEVPQAATRRSPLEGQSMSARNGISWSGAL